MILASNNRDLTTTIQILQFEGNFGALINAIKSLPSATYHSNDKTWTVNCSLDNVRERLRRLDTVLFDIRNFTPIQPHLIVPDRRNIDDLLIPPFDFQVEGATYLYNIQSGILGDVMGLGKQQPIDTLTLTPSGWKQLGKIKVGDYVIGSNGAPTKVRRIYPQGIKPSYRITFSDHSCVEAGPEHLWTMRYKIGGRRWEDLVLTTQQIIDRPKLTKKHNNGVTTSLDLSKTVLHLPMLSSPVIFDTSTTFIDAYTLGCLIGNGNLTHSSATLTSSAIDWPEINKYIVASSSRQYGNVVQATISGIISKIRDLGLNVKSKSKFIPRTYLQSSVDNRIALLQGLMDTDGSISNTRNRVCYHTISLQLAKDIQELAEGLGCIASIRTYDRTTENKPIEYQIRIRFPEWITPFRINRKLSKYKPGKLARPTRTVKSIEYIRDVESMCISVEAEDQLYTTEHCILTHNSVQLIYTIWKLYCDGLIRNALIICPATLKLQWSAEIEKFLGDVPVTVIDGTVKKREKLYQQSPLYTIINYELVLKDIDILLNHHYDVIALDEAHRISNYKNKTTKQVNKLNAPYKFAATGTLLQNRPDELYSIFSFVNPNILGTFSNFARQYMVFGNKYNKGNMTIAYRNLDQLARTTAPYILRRVKEDVSEHLPTITVNEYFVTLPPNQKAVHDQISNDLLELMKTVNAYREYGPTGEITKEHPKAGQIPGLFTLLQEICDSPALLSMSDSKMAHHYAINDIRSPKLNELTNIIGDLDADKIVIFTQFHRMQMLIAEHIKSIGKYVLLHGQMSVQQKEDAKNNFRNDPTIKFFISTNAGKEGLNLEVASAVINFDIPWNPSIWEQRVGRIDRIITKHNVLTVINILAQNGIDSRIKEAMYQKAKTSSRIIKTDRITASMIGTILR